MGSFARPISTDQWIDNGGIVVAASDRAARAAQLAYHRRRRAEGVAAWPAPPIQSWTAFISAAWDMHARDERMILNPAQEQHLWAGIIAADQHRADTVTTTLDAPRRRLARLAMDAHALLCAYAPRFLRESARAGWDRDAGAFSRWLAAFDQACAQNACVSQSRLATDLVQLLQSSQISRPPILLIGFDRLLPIHKALFEAWGTVQQPEPGPPAVDIRFYQATDPESELAACASWCLNQLAQKPDARLLVISQEIAACRGEIERAFLRSAPPASPPLFEFSLGVPLLQIPLARAAFLWLRWLHGSLTENELDWLFSSGCGAAGANESVALQSAMRTLRRRDLARPEWPLDAFLRSKGLPSAWLRRTAHAQSLLSAARSRTRTPIEWNTTVPDLLRALGLPSEHTLSSAEFQAWQRWEYALDLTASLGFDGQRIAWNDFLASLERVMETTLFAPESTDAPIQIAGPGESAGLTADGIWFLGANEDAWPASASAHPLLPIALQREYGLPHASPRHDADLAASITRRLIESANVVHFSFASQIADTAARPSRVIALQAGALRPIPAPLAIRRPAMPRTIGFEDASHVPFAPGKVPGGASVLTAQSQCPFKAFATARLGAKPWKPAEFGLSASERGRLLHHVMHAVWGGPPDGFRSLQDLLSCTDRQSFVVTHVSKVLEQKLSEETRRRMPQQYIALEAKRLIGVVSQWLDYEAARLPFTVVQTETASTVDVAGLSLDLRLDRTDELNNGSLLVIDYKTGNVSPRAWDLPRPDDVQLPLYAGFAAGPRPGGLVFAKVRAGDFEFTGRVVDANATLMSFGRATTIVKRPLTTEQLADWRGYIEQLARDFLAGRADVDPRDYPKTCDDCGLHSICRVHENCTEPEPEEDEEPPHD
jgi:ATP-dependent helicase/nuclease subunit B